MLIKTDASCGGTLVDCNSRGWRIKSPRIAELKVIIGLRQRKRY